MASLADLFNPTFLMFLGILVLVVALLVVYFESKMREQNHKIASMLSLVSTLAEDMNNVKMGLNHLAIRGSQQPTIPVGDNLVNLQKMNLIEVSDDEESEDETSHDDESNNEESVDDDSVDDESNNDDLEDDLAIIEDGSKCDNDDIKIVKLQVSNEDVDEDNDLYEEANNLEFDAVEDLADLDGDLIPEVNNEYVEEVLDLKYDEAKQLEETNIISSSDLKTISINLGEEHQHNEENIDYKKLQLPKLRSIAVEKGLTSNSEASKLKKPELLKLLGAE